MKLSLYEGEPARTRSQDSNEVSGQTRPSHTCATITTIAPACVSRNHQPLTQRQCRALPTRTSTRPPTTKATMAKCRPSTASARKWYGSAGAIGWLPTRASALNCDEYAHRERLFFANVGVFVQPIVAACNSSLDLVG